MSSVQISDSVTSRYFSNKGLNSRNTAAFLLRKTPKCSTVVTKKIIEHNEDYEKNFKPSKKRARITNILDPNVVLASSLNVSDEIPSYGLQRVKDSFYNTSCEELAKQLLGHILVRRLDDGTILKGRIVETECYLGGEDKASHSYNGRITERSKPMYMKPGTTYVYFTYGMYHCFNISSKGPGAVVLIRAVDPLEGFHFMKEQREKKKKVTSTKVKELKPHELCNGPGKLCISFNITKQCSNEKDLTIWNGMWIEKDETFQNVMNPCHIVTSHRIGIDSAGIEWASKPLRFYLLGNVSVSKRDKAKERELQEMFKLFV
ncbi:hypothetical protein C0J52_18469 [Blattella germanica]|nr:hypothetical protein C0J52_18469 [Blattella germanica]